MAIVLNIGQQITATVLDMSAKQCSISNYFILDGFSVNDLISPDVTNEIMQVVLEEYPEAAAHKIYACFSAQSGIAYKTFRQPAESFQDSSLKNEQEKEDLILRVALENIPEGLQNLYAEYVPSIISCYYAEAENIVTASYLPKVYIDNLVNACRVFGLSLVKITDTADAITKLLRPAEQLFIVQCTGQIIAVNPFGTIAWLSLPGITDITPVHEVLMNFFPITAEAKPIAITPQQIGDYVPIRVETDYYDSEIIYTAVGCIINSKIKKGMISSSSEENIEKGENENFIGKLRQFFKKK